MSVKTFQIWFEQVNAYMVEVDATDEAHARAEAEREWRRQNQPDIVQVSVLGKNDPHRKPNRKPTVKSPISEKEAKDGLGALFGV